MLFLQKIFASTLLVAALLASPIRAQYPGPGYVTGDTLVHDPAVVKTPSGTYLMAHTGNGISLKTSTDRTAWRNVGAAFPNGASWTTPYTNGNLNLWAPDISYRNGKYYLYYSASTFGSNKSAVFLATSTTGAAGSWTHVGLIIETSSSNNWNAIDPNLIVDPQGRWWLSVGSFWGGIKLIAINPSTGLRLDGQFYSIAARPDAGGSVEAPFITRRGNYYYLWVSFDACCRGSSSTYRTMVGRSSSITGPYIDRNGKSMTQGGGTQVLASHGPIYGPGHPAILADNDGDVLFYHYYTSSNQARLGINLIRYENDWPVVY